MTDSQHELVEQEEKPMETESPTKDKKDIHPSNEVEMNENNLEEDHIVKEKEPVKNTPRSAEESEKKNEADDVNGQISDDDFYGDKSTERKDSERSVEQNQNVKSDPNVMSRGNSDDDFFNDKPADKNDDSESVENNKAIEKEKSFKREKSDTNNADKNNENSDDEFLKKKPSEADE